MKWMVSLTVIVAAACGNRMATTQNDATLDKVERKPPGSDCAKNEECSSWCFFPEDDPCGEAGPGTCAPEPDYIPHECMIMDPYDPEVCGCDGKTYENHCSTGGVKIRYRTGCKTCDELAAAYQEVIDRGKRCDQESLRTPGTSPPPPGTPVCTKLVDDAIECGCPTFVISHSGPGGSILRDKLRAAWRISGCKPKSCPKCTEPISGDCSSFGFCVTNY